MSGLTQEAQGSLACRKSFEDWIGGPPYERDLYRYPVDETKHAWPGQYKDISVQLAWEAWQESRLKTSLRLPLLA